jgi:uncharacterized protein YdbL (DUF1318 family)
MRRLFSLKLALASLLFAACVTINVYFPAAAAEKAADKIITDVLGEAPAGTSAPKEKTEGTGADGAASSSLRFDVEPAHLLAHGAEALLNLIAPPAYAQGADLDISSPAIKAITDSMRDRTNGLKKYYDSGAVGFTADGMIEVRDQNLVPLPERGEVRRLVAEQNKDSAALYAEIASENKHPEWEADIRKTFGERLAARAKQSGWYFKDAGGTWQK